MNSHPVAIILVTWNGISDTLACLESLYKIDYKEFEVIVVDNNSTDQTVNVLKKKFPSIHFILNKKNEGFAPAVNKGIQAALKLHFENILLLNNDTIVQEDFLINLVSELYSHKKAGIVGSKIYYFGTDKTIWFAGGKFDLKSGFFHNLGQLEKDKNERKVKSVDFVSGCSLLFKSEILSKIGFLNESFESYVEDIEFNLKAKDNGYEILLVPKSIVWHKVSMSTGGEGNKRKTFLIIRNTVFFTRTYLYNKYGPTSYFYLAKYIFFQLALSLKQKRYTSTMPIFHAIIAGFFSSI